MIIAGPFMLAPAFLFVLFSYYERINVIYIPNLPREGIRGTE